MEIGLFLHIITKLKAGMLFESLSMKTLPIKMDENELFSDKNDAIAFGQS